jgi:hypothetical protein
VNPENKMEEYLKTAKIVSIKKPSIGRTEPWIIHLDNGILKRRGIFKHLNSPRPTIIPDSYLYEIAAYKLNKLLGLKIIPPVVKREINDVEGSLQLMLEEIISLDIYKRKNMKPPDQYIFVKNMALIKIFENLTFSKHVEEDILIQKNNWKIWRVDFGESFAPKIQLFPEFDIKHCPKRFYNNLKTLDRNIVHKELHPYLNNEEINALLKRKGLILEKIDKLIEKLGKDVVLY